MYAKIITLIFNNGQDLNLLKESIGYREKKIWKSNLKKKVLNLRHPWLIKVNTSLYIINNKIN